MVRDPVGAEVGLSRPVKPTAQADQASISARSYAVCTREGPRMPFRGGFMVGAAWRRAAWLIGLCAMATAGAVLAQAVASRGPAAVDQQRFTQADQEPGQWMGIGRDWTEQRYQPAHPDQRQERPAPGPGLVRRPQHLSRRGGDPAGDGRGALQHLGLETSSPPTTPPPARCCGPTTPRSPLEWARLACCGPVSRGLAAWNGKIIIARARRPPDRAGRQDRQAGVERRHPRARSAAVDHRRAAHRRRPCGHWQRRRRLRRPRLHLRL